MSPVDCGAPQPPASGYIAPYTSTLEGAVISFQCNQGFSPPEERTATCARDEDTGSGAWTPDSAQHTCTRIPPSGLSIGAIVGIVLAALFVIITTGLVVVACIVVRCRSGAGTSTSKATNS